MTIPHRRAVLLMCSAAALWSIVGVLTRQLEAARGFEVTFWLGAGEVPAMSTLTGGVVVLAALVGNEFVALHEVNEANAGEDMPPPLS